MYDGPVSANSLHITPFSEASDYETLLVNTKRRVRRSFWTPDFHLWQGSTLESYYCTTRCSWSFSLPVRCTKKAKNQMHRRERFCPFICLTGAWPFGNTEWQGTINSLKSIKSHNRRRSSFYYYYYYSSPSSFLLLLLYPLLPLPLLPLLLPPPLLLPFILLTKVVETIKIHLIFNIFFPKSCRFLRQCGKVY